MQYLGHMYAEKLFVVYLTLKFKSVSHCRLLNLATLPVAELGCVLIKGRP